MLLIENDYRRLRSFAGRSKIETWIHTIVRHCVGQHLWRRRWENDTVSVDDLLPDALTYQPIKEKILIDEDEWKALQAIISSLPERRRQLIELALKGFKTGEIAEEMRVKISYIYSEKSALSIDIRELLKGR